MKVSQFQSSAIFDSTTIVIEDECPVCGNLVQYKLEIRSADLYYAGPLMQLPQLREAMHKVALALGSHIYHGCKNTWDTNAVL